MSLNSKISMFKELTKELTFLQKVERLVYGLVAVVGVAIGAVIVSIVRAFRRPADEAPTQYSGGYGPNTVVFSKTYTLPNSAQHRVEFVVNQQQFNAYKNLDRRGLITKYVAIPFFDAVYISDEYYQQLLDMDIPTREFALGRMAAESLLYDAYLEYGDLLLTPGYLFPQVKAVRKLIYKKYVEFGLLQAGRLYTTQQIKEETVRDAKLGNFTEKNSLQALQA